MPNYQNGKIYKIVSESAGLTYYGSTCVPLAYRLAGHRASHKRRDCSSCHVLDYADYKIVLVEDYPCKEKHELRSREGYYVKNNDCVNKDTPGKTDEEKKKEAVARAIKNREKNLDHRLEYEKEYREKNAERISDYAKEWREKNKEKIKAKKAEKELCVCGEYYTMPHKNRHMKTKKHQNFISAQNK